MTRRLIGVAGVALALLGCSEDPTRLSVVDESAPPPRLPSSATATALARSPGPLALRDDPPKEKDDSKKDDKAPATAEEAVKKGLELANKNELVAATEQFDLAHKLDPKNRQALYFVAAVRLIRAEQTPEGKDQSALFLRSAEAARKLRDLAGKEIRPQEKGLIGRALYKEACALAKDNQADKAMASLNEAVDAGFSDGKAMAADDDLKSLRSRPEFPRLVEKVKDAAKKAMKEQDDMMTAQMLPEVKREVAAFPSFPFKFELPGLDGKPVKLDDFKGKVVIVDVWGTWCPPCRMEIPHFIALHDAYKDKGLEIVGINKERVPPGKVKETIETFAKEMGINYPLVVGDDKVEESVPDFSGYPTTLFVDRTGKVRYKHVGYAPYEVLDYIVKTLLDEKPKTP
jgi:thiol-disulfide isomerase/thioredoxin